MHQAGTRRHRVVLGSLVCPIDGTSDLDVRLCGDRDHVLVLVGLLLLFLLAQSRAHEVHEEPDGDQEDHDY